MKRIALAMRARLRALLRRSEVERELAEELQAHLNERIAYEVARGKDPELARREALLDMQGVEQQKELCRDARGLAWLETFLRDLRLAFRSLRKSPGFTAVAVLTLTLGIGANTAIYSVVHAVLLRPLPFHEPDRLVRVYETNSLIQGFHFNFHSPNFLYLRERSRSYESIAAVRGYETFTLAGEGGAELLRGLEVTANFLSTLGVEPALGRDFADADADEGVRAAIVGHELWRRRLAADPNAVGGEIRLNAQSYTGVGVLPPGFRSPTEYGAPEVADLLLPYGFAGVDVSREGTTYNNAIARLGSGVDLEQARAEAETLAAGLDDAFAFKQRPNMRLHVVSLYEDKVGNYRNSLLVLLGATGLVLLISCANVANALLARGAAQAREYAVRLAIGAGRGALVRQILAQNVVLGTLGCVGGVLAAYWTLEALVALAPARIPRLDQIAIDAPTVAFAVATSSFTVVAFGLLPALRLSGTQPNLSLQGRGSGSPEATRWRSVLVAAQAALSVMLLVGAGLFLRSFAHLRGVDVGFAPDRTAVFSLHLPQWRYADADARSRLFQDLAARVELLPGVESAGYSSGRPMRLLAWGPAV